MSVYTPDRWVVLEITDGSCSHDNQKYKFYKVFGTWAGGYLYGDSWRMNSGIERITSDSERFYFHGYSGSVYECRKDCEGIAGAYNHPVLNDLLKHPHVRLVNFEEEQMNFIIEELDHD